MAAVEVDLEPSTQGLARPEHGDRLDQAGKHSVIHRCVEFTAHDVNELGALSLELGAAHVVLSIGCTNGELGQRIGEDGDLISFRVLTQLVAVEREARLQSQGVSRA